MSKITETLVTLAVAIIGLATLAVVVSKKSKTSSVITDAGKAFDSVLKITVSPISGAS